MAHPVCQDFCPSDVYIMHWENVYMPMFTSQTLLKNSKVLEDHLKKLYGYFQKCSEINLEFQDHYRLPNQLVNV